jgi:scyllo-inositol 2-dehydrogenase (NADP+)
MTHRKIVVGIASFGMSGKVFHGPLLGNHEHFVLKRIIERSSNEAHALYPNAIVSGSFEDLLKDDEIEVVVVNTPDKSHYALARTAIGAGKHVIVEKPITQTVEQGEELIALARDQRVMLTVFQNRRWDGDFMTVQDVVRKNLLGPLVDFESHYDRYRYGIQSGSWKERADSGAGVLYNLGAHMIDQVLMLFGLPEAVTALVRQVRTRTEVDDWYDIKLHYPGMVATTKCSYLVREPGPRYILHGTLGSFIKHGLDPQEEALNQGQVPGSAGWGKESQEWWGTLNTEVNGLQRRVVVESKAGNYSAFYDNVYDCIVHRTNPPVNPEDSVNVIRIIEAAKRSNQERRTIVL